MSVNVAGDPTCAASCALGATPAKAEHDDDYDEMTVAELDAVIDDWEIAIPKSLNKAEKIAALRAADAEE